MSGEIDRYNIFHASMLVRHSNDGKMYLYDIIDIKKNEQLSRRIIAYQTQNPFLLYTDDTIGYKKCQSEYSIFEVKESTEEIIKGLSYSELTQKIPKGRKECLKSLNVVSTDENAVWLIDYWCNKDIRGLIQMLFSRHWIMHTEACLRIKNKN